MTQMSWRSILTLTGVLAVAVSGCEGYDDGKGPQIDCATATVPNYADVTMFEVCENCHASSLSGAQRQDAPGDVNFDTYDAAKASAEESLYEVYNGDMPINGYTVTDEQKQAFYAWAQCGTPQ
jgi:uncharacterized membrane protein